jgi:chromosome segregation ATPase
LATARADLQHEATLSSDDRVELHAARDNAISEKGQLEREVYRLDQLIAWQRNTESADATIKTARKKITVAEKEIAKLASNREKVAGKLAKVSSEITQLQTRASENEQAAAKDYAAVLASGDDSAEQTAQAKLERAGDAVDEARRKATRQQPVIDALSSELASIDAAYTEASEQLQEIQREQMAATRYKLCTEWDVAAKAMIELGARLTAASRISGNGISPLGDLLIPMFGLDGERTVGRFEIDQLTDSISRGNLVEA